jgi:hypothetical protein
MRRRTVDCTQLSATPPDVRQLARALQQALGQALG